MTNITLCCINCGQELDYSVDANGRIGIEFAVTSCVSCRDDDIEEAREEGKEEGYEEGKKEFFEEHRLRDPDE